MGSGQRLGESSEAQNTAGWLFLKFSFFTEGFLKKRRFSLSQLPTGFGSWFMSLHPLTGCFWIGRYLSSAVCRATCVRVTAGDGRVQVCMGDSPHPNTRNQDLRAQGSRIHISVTRVLHFENDRSSRELFLISCKLQWDFSQSQMLGMEVTFSSNFEMFKTAWEGDPSLQTEFIHDLRVAVYTW